MNAKEYAEMLGISRKFLDNYHKQNAKKPQERWTLEVWESHREDILARYKLGGHKKNTDNIPVMILKSKGEILGIYQMEEKEALHQYVRNHLVFKKKYYDRYKQQKSNIDNYIKKLEIESGKFNRELRKKALAFLLTWLVKTDSLENDYVLKEGRKNPNNIPENKKSIEEIKRENEAYLPFEALIKIFSKWCSQCPNEDTSCRKAMAQRRDTEYVIEWKEKRGLIDEIIFGSSKNKERKQEFNKPDLKDKYLYIEQKLPPLEKNYNSEFVKIATEMLNFNLKELNKDNTSFTTSDKNYLANLEEIDYIKDILNRLDNITKKVQQERQEALDKAKKEYLFWQDKGFFPDDFPLEKT